MGSISEFKLLGTPASPFTNRVQFVLKLKSIDYEFIEENLACKSDLILKSNPIHKKIPILFHANNPPISESLIIIEYLDELKPDVHPMLPSNALDRAHHRFWAHYIDTKFFPLMRGLWLTQVKQEQEAMKEQIIESAQLLEEAFLKLSNGKTYFGGDEPGYLDAVLGCFIGGAILTEKLMNFKVFDDVRNHGLVVWAKSMITHEASRNLIPGQDTLMNFYALLQNVKPSN